MPTKTAKCGVIGNPIKHSLSPNIHAKFAQDTKVELEYDKYLLQETELKDFIHEFFNSGGVGLNVTAPFKQPVLQCVDELTEAAKTCQSVNTISIGQSGQLVGDTTDGAGIMLDLERLGYVTKNSKVLLLGAGGATVPVVRALLLNQCDVTIMNRTETRVEKIAQQLKSVGNVNLFVANQSNEFDGVICALSHFNREMLQLAAGSLKSDAFVYDLNYAERAEETIGFFKLKGFSKLSDGYGMLIGQAAKSFQIWHGKMPPLNLE